MPVAQWFKLEVFLSQSTNTSGAQSNYDGQLSVGQDGVEIYSLSDVATRYPDSWNEWSYNVYTKTNGVSANGSPTDFTAYADDVAILAP